MTLTVKNVFVPKSLGQLDLRFDGNNFSVIESGGRKIEVQKAFVGKELRGITSEQLNRICEVGYLSLKKLTDLQSEKYEYGVEFSPRLPGGGPFLGALTQVALTGVGAALVLFPPTAAVGVAVIATAPAVAVAVTFTPTP